MLCCWAAACMRGKSGMNGGWSLVGVVGRGAHVLEEPLEAAGQRAHHAGGFLDLVGVREAGRHVAEVAGVQQLGVLGALGVLVEEPHLALEHVERLVGLVVRVRRDDVAGGGVGGDDAELVLGLVTGEQHGEQVGEEHRVLALALAQHVGLRLAGQHALPLRALGGVDQVLEAHGFSRVGSAVTRSSIGDRASPDPARAIERQRHPAPDDRRTPWRMPAGRPAR